MQRITLDAVLNWTPRFGRYVPGKTNILLLAVQVLFAVQAASRGEDYIFPRPEDVVAPSLSSIERALPLPVWGSGFLLAAALVLVGLFGGWLTSIVIGHFILAGLYGAFSYGMLDQAPIENFWLAGAGAVVLVVGLATGLTRWPHREMLRFVIALLLTGVGGWVCGYGLGYNFRTATGLLIAGLIHAAFVVGMTWIASRAPGRGLAT